MLGEIRVETSKLRQLKRLNLKVQKAIQNEEEEVSINLNQLNPHNGIVTDSQLPRFDMIHLLIIFHYSKCDLALCHQIYSIYSVKQLQSM